MALTITPLCICCDACLHVCPNGAVRAGRPYRIAAARCTECAGDHAEAQCAAICPIEGALVDALGAALNPPGSLTGIPPPQGVSLQLVAAAR